MIVHTDALPDFVIVDPRRMLPRFWATAWSLTIQGHALAENTRKIKLRHIDAFYLFCDERFGLDSFDSAISLRDAERIRQLVEAFYLEITSSPAYTTTTVQRWDCVRDFVQRLARQRAPSSRAWSSLSSALWAMGRIRQPRRGRFRFIRAIPVSTLVELLDAARPSATGPVMPFASNAAGRSFLRSVVELQSATNGRSTSTLKSSTIARLSSRSLVANVYSAALGLWEPVIVDATRRESRVRPSLLPTSGLVQQTEPPSLWSTRKK